MPTAARAQPPPAASAVREPQLGLPPPLFWTLATLTVLALIVSRRPDGITNPQFWAEDGTFWYAQAHQAGGLTALRIPAAGYLQSFSRLAAAASLVVDLRWAPLVMNVLATFAQALAPLLLLSERFAHLIPDLRLRALAALLWIGAPNGFEVQSNVTNSQTHLAMLALLLVLATPPRSVAGRVTDVLLLLLAGFAGPTCVLLVPVAALAWWHDRAPWRLVLLLVLLVPASAQAATYVATAGHGRVRTPLGATPLRLLQIVGGQIVLGGTLGVDGYRGLRWLGEPWYPVGTALLGAAGLLFVGRALAVSRSLALRLLVLFASLELAAGLASPAIAAVPRWEGMRIPGAGIRYYAPPILAWLAVLLWSAGRDPDRRVKLLARASLAGVLLLGLPLDWRVQARPDLAFASHAARYDAAAPGTVVNIPIPPVGWSMRLVKR
jgi:hypothetical protein